MLARRSEPAVFEVSPDFERFQAAYEAGRPQVVHVKLVDDLETPVSAYLKIGHGRPFAFLFESVEGGAWRGRYSIVAMKPDLVWRCRGDAAEISEGADLEAGVYRPQAGGALDSLRDLIARSAIALPKDVPPMAAGVFGAIGYDMVRLAEPLPDVNPDPLDLPDSVMTRPSIVAVFDSIGQEIVLVTPVRPVGLSAQDAYAKARRRLEDTIADLRRPLPVASDRVQTPQAPLTSPVSRADYGRMVEAAKGYIRAGDIFQVVPSHRFSAPRCEGSIRRPSCTT
jgi:anthranilate synthase component 1